MVFIALKRLWSRPGLSLLSLVSIVLIVGIVVSIPVFAQAVSFVMFQEELAAGSRFSRILPFALRIYISPSARYKVSLRECQALTSHIEQTIVSEMGLPVISVDYYIETMGSVLRTRDEETLYRSPNAFLSNIKLAVLPGVTPYLTMVDGERMDRVASSPHSQPTGTGVMVWMHRTLAQEMGVAPGEQFEVHDPWRNIVLPVRVAGIWEASDPQDPYWHLSPEANFYQALLVRPTDYVEAVEPLFRDQLGFAFWYLVIDDIDVRSERIETYAEGLHKALDTVLEYLPDNQVDSILVSALDAAVQREDKLTVLLFVFSVPVIGFLLYFVTLISMISLRWQQREIAVMASRGMRNRQLLVVALVEALLIAGVGLPLGFVVGLQLARLMGYVRGFMTFTWRESLPISPKAYNLPVLVAAAGAVILARLWPSLRSARVSVVSHEQSRSRARIRPFWQRYYLDFLLLVPVVYAYRQLAVRGTLVPEALAGDQGPNSIGQDSLLFLVPALFALTLSLLVVRVFPLLMRIGDLLSAWGRSPMLYLAFRQLARQSDQYVSALLLVITSLSLGAFMASMALSLDRWLVDQVYYEVGADALIVQMANPDPDMRGPPTEGAWILPASSYQQVPGVVDATRVGMYPATVLLAGQKSLRGTVIGVDRIDAARVLFFRPDFADLTLGELMNQLARREDAVLVSETVLAQGGYQVGDSLRISVDVADIPLTADFTIVGTFRYFPTVYEKGKEQTAVISNLDYLFQRIGATLLHDIWLRIEPNADRLEMERAVRRMGVHAERWIDARDEIARERARGERLGIYGTLTTGFLAAAFLSGIGLLVYNYASLQERLFRFTVLRAVGLALGQVVGQVAIEYAVLMVYSVAGGVAIGVWASHLFVPFFQAADKNVLRPPTMIPMIAWEDIAWISAAFTMALIAAQIVVLGRSLRRGVFQALRMGDAE